MMLSLYPSERDTLEVVTAIHAFIERVAILVFIGVVACDVVLHLIGDKSESDKLVSWNEHVWNIDLRGFTKRLRLPQYTGRLSSRAILKVVSLIAFGVAIGLEFIALPYSERIDELTRLEQDDSRRQTIRSVLFASEANRKAKSAELETARLYALTAPRRLSPEEQAAVTNSCRRFAGRIVLIDTYVADTEAMALADQIFSVLHSSLPLMQLQTSGVRPLLARRAARNSCDWTIFYGNRIFAS